MTIWYIVYLVGILRQEKSGNPGTDVMITIFCEKLAFFSKTNVMIKKFLISFDFSQKCQFFRRK
jgi:hypothetical protein